MVSAGAVELSTNTTAAVPPIAAAAVPTIAAATSPSTWRRLSRLKAEPKYRSIKPAINSTWQALHKAKTMEVERLQCAERLPGMLATIVPTATANLVPGPRAIRTPAATPAAGQNQAMSSGLVRRKKLSRDA